MKKKIAGIIIAIMAVSFLFAVMSIATVPPLTVNLKTSFSDATSNLTGSTCCTCHNNYTDYSANTNRHCKEPIIREPASSDIKDMGTSPVYWYGAVVP